MIGEIITLKRKVFRIIIFFLVCLACIAFLITQIKLEKYSDRDIVGCTLKSDLKEYIIARYDSLDAPHEIIGECSKLVCESLSFTAKNDIKNGKANCVGYAQLTSATTHYAFQIKNLPYKAKPVVGKVYLFGIDLNNISQKILPLKYRPFFKDHDFVEIDLGDKILYVDSTLHDLIGYNFYQTKL